MLSWRCRQMAKTVGDEFVPTQNESIGLVVFLNKKMVACLTYVTLKHSPCAESCILLTGQSCLDEILVCAIWATLEDL